MASKQTVLYEAPQGDKTIGAALARTMRYVDDRRKTWPPGEADDYRRWAISTIRGALQRFAECLVCHVPDDSIGKP